MSFVPQALFADDGIVGDAHRGSAKDAPVLVQDQEDLDDLQLRPGIVRENVTVEGVGVNRLPIGTLLALGQVTLEVIKVCRPCSLMEDIRPGLRAELRDRRGMYARVVEPGIVRLGDRVEVLSAGDRAAAVAAGP
jgi:MOSC domain-containing protein YiiM